LSNELSEENSYGVSEAYTMKRPDVTKIEMLESEIKVLKNKINAAGIPECCRI
jgi:predicted RNA-binding protein